MEYNNENRGVLFQNDKKGNDKSPDMQGNINVDSGEYQLSAWTKVSKAGKRYLSLSIQPKSKVQQNDLPQSQPPAKDEDLPF